LAAQVLSARSGWVCGLEALRVIVTGASGSGTSTLGRALASRLASQHFDADDFFWLPTDEPYCDQRPVAERLYLMDAVFVPRRDWVLSGSVMSWDQTLRPRLTLAVLLRLDPALRLARLEKREALRRGRDILPGGRHHASHVAFMAWCRGYDDPAFSGRSLRRHQEWLAGLACKTMTLDSDAQVDALVEAVVAQLDQTAQPA
jgi:adenylate kinase family enzyme